MTYWHERNTSLLKVLEIWKHVIESMNNPMTIVPIREEMHGKLFDFDDLIFFLLAQNGGCNIEGGEKVRFDEWSWRWRLFDIVEVNFEDIDSFVGFEIVLVSWQFQNDIIVAMLRMAFVRTHTCGEVFLTFSVLCGNRGGKFPEQNLKVLKLASSSHLPSKVRHTHVPKSHEH